ncbi:MAG: TetR/AcrR family transcriptional regulator [Scrofimicrobium sp.]
MARKGSYPKGDAKREEILERSLSVIAEQGFNGTSVKALAEAVGLSKAGLMHYFDSKEELFTAIIRKRDEVDQYRLVASIDTFEEMREAYVALVRHNAQVPGLVQLFSYLSVQAANPEHPAHDYFLWRSTGMRALWLYAINRWKQTGQIRNDIDPESAARIIQATTDGMQLQWMIEPEVDMAKSVEVLLSLLADTSK